MIAFASAFVRVVAHGGVLLMALAVVLRRIPVGIEALGQRGVKFGLRAGQPLAEIFPVQPFAQAGQSNLNCGHSNQISSQPTLHNKKQGSTSVLPCPINSPFVCNCDYARNLRETKARPLKPMPNNISAEPPSGTKANIF